MADRTLGELRPTRRSILCRLGYEMAHRLPAGAERPDYCGISHADVLTGVYAFGAISAALYSEHRTQTGQAYRRVDVKLDAEPDAERIGSGRQFAVKPTQAQCAARSKPRDGYVMVAIF